MPVITNGTELPILPNSYSTRALERDCTELGSAYTLDKQLVRFYVENGNNYACVVLAEPVEGRHQVITKLEFNQSRKDLISVSHFFEDDSYQQVELVATSKKIRNSGIATALYELLVCVRELTVVSDFEQFEGGKAVWQKLAERGVVDVYVYDSKEDQFLSADGDKTRYNGSNIPDSAIWSVDPSREKEHVLLTASK